MQVIVTESTHGIAQTASYVRIDCRLHGLRCVPAAPLQPLVERKMVSDLHTTAADMHMVNLLHRIGTVWITGIYSDVVRSRLFGVS